MAPTATEWRVCAAATLLVLVAGGYDLAAGRRADGALVLLAAVLVVWSVCLVVRLVRARRAGGAS